MYVRVNAGTASVEDVRNLRQLHVELAGIDDRAAAEALAGAGLGELDGDHAWLRIAALRAAGEDAWRAEFDAMIEYARTKGWVDGERVRAHVVRA
ncbi:hypothetical protein [Actinophytocola gossypii]|uniref:Uncharacterized protein n=1 Tax=Actinophytocola gossypii TaxID=2812003 RepID=A0ABT2J162_9PSEU|nr:hypothetical protein [Actinophytocola gossypii]MCT2581603.1 hypothetical protein [Actinophytocola gossypii]